MSPRFLQAGPLAALWEDGTLRRITIEGVEVVRQIYVAVRDQDWGTVPPRILDETIEEHNNGFVVRLSVEHVDNEADFLWNGTITARVGAPLVFAMTGVVRRPFLRNRIGFCVLHPHELAGAPVAVETPSGGVITGTFPVRIAPHQPFEKIRALRYHGIALHFAGDMFEMEDQRNWTDASFKTYCTPLALPFPVRVCAGERVEQSVTLQFPPSSPPRPPSLGGEDRVGQTLGVVQAAGARETHSSPPKLGGLGGRLGGQGGRRAGRGGRFGVTVHVGDERGARLPPLGLTLSPAPLTETQAARLRALRLAHLRVDLDLREPSWSATLGRAVAAAERLNIALLELEVRGASDNNEEGLDDLLARVAAATPRVARIFLYAGDDLVTSAGVLARAHALRQRHGLPVALLGGGSRAYFTQLNRAQDQLPLAGLAFAGYTINPQVHAFDDTTLIESLPVQALTVQNARAITNLPLCVGPITLRPRFAATATSPNAPPPLLGEPDPRQTSPFCAGWTVGSLFHLSAAGPIASLTYYETVGPRGLMDASSTPFPVYDVFAGLADLAGANVLPVRVSNPLAVQALAVRSGEQTRIFVANVTNEPMSVTLGVAEQRLKFELPPLGIERVEANYV